MATQRYSVASHPIETLLTWVNSGEIAIPEIRRPFLWDSTKVRNLLDSRYQGYPVGHLIAWRNPSVRLKDGSSSSGKQILIYRQQRVTALVAALLGREVLTKDYETVRIRIAFHPMEEKFEVSNPATKKDVAWITDLAEVFAPDASLTKLTRDYATRNPDVDQDKVSRLSVARHHGVRSSAEPQQLASRLSAQSSQEARADAWALQPDRQLCSGAERDQHRHWRQGAGGLLRGDGRTVPWRAQEVRWHHRTREMRANLRMTCLLKCWLNRDIPEVDHFLEQGRKLMAQKIKIYFEGL